MESLRGRGAYFFSGYGRVAGLLIRIQRRAYVVGATQRGFFYRFGARIFSPCNGYFESVFGLRTSVGEFDLMLKSGMQDEVLPVSFGRNRIRGAMHFQRTGCISFVVSSLSSEVFPKVQGAIAESIATPALYGDSFYDSDA